MTDISVRRKLVYESHEAFCSIYLSHHTMYPYAFFHKEMFRITESYSDKLNVIMAFRGSGKSTIMNLSNAIWSIAGKHQKKFVLIISKTRLQSQSHFNNIKDELESNELLKQDLGPFKEGATDWGALSIELPLYGAKIMCIGSLQNIRGLKYKNRRPDLIICDDLEDITSVQDKNDRDLLFNWFLNEVMSIGDKDTNIVVLGNLLCDDSLMVRLKKIMMHNQLKGSYYAYPLLDDNLKILWPQRYSPEDVLEIQNSLPLKKSSDLYSMFGREFLLDMSNTEGLSKKYFFDEVFTDGRVREDFEISVPLWAFGSLVYGEDGISDIDGYKKSRGVSGT